jgi:hypothetical protein
MVELGSLVVMGGFKRILVLNITMNQLRHSSETRSSNNDQKPTAGRYISASYFRTRLLDPERHYVLTWRNTPAEREYATLRTSTKPKDASEVEHQEQAARRLSNSASDLILRIPILENLVLATVSVGAGTIMQFADKLSSVGYGFVAVGLVVWAYTAFLGGKIGKDTTRYAYDLLMHHADKFTDLTLASLVGTVFGRNGYGTKGMARTVIDIPEIKRAMNSRIGDATWEVLKQNAEVNV